ncbi:ribonuclease H-like domain-containing protein [Cadophora sp. MPI-SDFR-AT-0126]|nr:ribonuclease H-like domain-containing protein [Leotiomycetes sp. MPI-SDFR-AT-0126]
MSLIVASLRLLNAVVADFTGGGGGLDIIAFSNSICERLEAQDEISGPLCLQCRQEFYSMNDLYEHQQADCWVSVSSLQYEEQWSPALYAYVRRALYPNNRAPGWTISDIIKSLEEMIMSNGRVGAVWETLDLPQRIAQPDPVVVVFRTVNQLGLTVSKIAAPLGYRGSNSSRTLTHVDGMPFVAYRDDGEMLVYSDGACSNNGQEIARGGCSFVFRCSDAVPWPWDIPQDVYSTHGGFFFRFEDVGPTNKHEQPTSNRAELRAAIAALRCIGPGQSEIRFSTPKDKSKLVVAMDSAYVVGGATKWAKVWETNGWRSSDGKAVKNQDLWEELLARVRELLSRHCAKVPFWHIPRRFNGDADRLAKYAATLKARPRFGVPSSPVTLVELSG